MQFKRITSKKDIYFDKLMEIYNYSFPEFERRTLNDQIEVLKNKNYKCTIVCEDNILIGIILYWEFENYKYIEHLAINKDFRGQSYGSKILKDFCSDNKIIILEIDLPIDEISIKRLNFYERLGFIMQEFDHIHPPYRKIYKGHKLKIMSFKRELLKKEYDKFNKFLEYEIMKYSECNN